MFFLVLAEFLRSQRSRLFLPPEVSQKGNWSVSVDVREPDPSKEEIQVKNSGILSNVSPGKQLPVLKLVSLPIPLLNACMKTS